MTAVKYLAEKYNYITWLQYKNGISAHKADKWRKKYLKEAKEMERKQHGNTWDAAIKPTIKEDMFMHAQLVILMNMLSHNAVQRTNILQIQKLINKIYINEK